MKLDRITISGADESVTPEQLHALSVEFPFVEWGILLSRNSEGKKPRYPSRQWINSLDGKGLKLSGHLCGAWVREFVYDGEATFESDRPEYPALFQRMQINFAGATYYRPNKGFWFWLQEHKKQYIFQQDGVNDGLMNDALVKNIDAVPLFDKSGGKGIGPDTWPQPYPGIYNGFAGGINHGNIADTLAKISASISGDAQVWVDMESGVRTWGEDDNGEVTDVFDLDKVRAVLQAAKPFVV
jgi:hypothetical protein